MSAGSMDVFGGLLGVLSVGFLVLKVVQNRAATNDGEPPEFLAFRNQFVWVYLIMMAADWLQGPTVYALYQHYGFTHEENAKLFIYGFGSSMIFGVFAGTIADKYGRKLACQIYGVSYALCCLSKHVNNFNVLMVGRLLGGFSTSLLWSAFESWMVSEHNQRKFDGKWIGGTFSMMVTRNGLVAIASGFAAQGAVALYGGHPVAPFDLSLLCLIVGTVIISLSWQENYGDTKATQTEGLTRAFATIVADPKIMLIGLIQSMFEGAMYIFVFVWTPILNDFLPKDVNPPHGLIFASFMISCAIGATVFSFLNERSVPEKFMAPVFVVASMCMYMPVATDNIVILMMSLCTFEVCVGIFWPSIMSMRSKYLPEEGRATLMNIFRIPLNFVVCCVLYQQQALSVRDDFKICAAAHACCALLVMRLAFYTQSMGREEEKEANEEMTA